MQTGVRLGIAIPQTALNRRIEPGKIRAVLSRAEALGFESAWVAEQTLGSVPSLEAVGLLTYAAAVTERIRLGSAVLLSALRNPVHLAKSLATLDQLSRGRLIVGLGLGGNPKIYPAFGLTAERRAARFAEGIRLIERLWTEPRLTFDGEFWKLENVAMEPKPVQKPHPPIWFGAHHTNALRRAVALGRGFMGAGSASTATFADEVTRLRHLLVEAGRDPATFEIGKRVYIAVDRDRARAARRLAEWFGAFYGRAELAERVSLWGPPDECVRGLAAIASAGAGLLVLNPVFDEVEQLDSIVAEVLPHLPGWDGARP